MEAGNNSILINIGKGAVWVAAIAIGGWLIWSQLIWSGRPKVIYLPKESRSAGPTAPPPNFGTPGPGQRGIRKLPTPQAPAGPPGAVDIAAFFTAVRSNNLAGVQSLLNSNSLLAQSVAADTKATALHEALSVEIAALLLQNGAKVDAPDSVHGDTPIRWHARDRTMDIVSYLYFSGKAQKPSDVFFLAATSNSDQTTLTNMIKVDPTLLESRSRANDVLGGQATPMLVGALWDRINVVTALLDAGAKLDDVIQGKSGASALHLAAWNDDPAMINLLLTRGASIEAMSSSPKGTPLTWAVMRGGRSSVQALLDHGAVVTPELIDLASKGVKGTDPADLPGKPADYSAIGLILRDHLSAAPATKP